MRAPKGPRDGELATPSLLSTVPSVVVVIVKRVGLNLAHSTLRANCLHSFIIEVPAFERGLKAPLIFSIPSHREVEVRGESEENPATIGSALLANRT